MAFVHRRREETPNDPKFSDRGGLAQPVPGSVVEAPDVTARSGSLQRMVRRRLNIELILVGLAADYMGRDIGLDNRKRFWKECDKLIASFRKSKTTVSSRRKK